MSSKIITTTLKVSNMSCVNCENTIERDLNSKLGIDVVKASYSSGTVTITYNQNEIDLEKIIKIIEAHDYYVQEQNDNSKTNTQSIEEKSTDLTNLIATGIIMFTIYVVLKRFGLLNIFYSFPIAKEGMSYGMLFIIGLFTSVHCVAMCGGICISQSASKETKSEIKLSKLEALRPSLLYNLGRVLSYTIIGGIVGALGTVVSFSGSMKGFIQIIAGLFMVIMGVNMLNVFPWLRKINPRMPKIFAKKIYSQRSKNNNPFFIGIFNGLMPCGPLQAMQLYALSTGDPIKGAFSMLLFSIGTFPLMFVFGALSSLLNKKFTGRMMKISAVLVLVLGVFMFNSGATLSGINIPIPSFLSTSQKKTINKATIKDGIQTVTSGISNGSYESVIIQKGIPVKWIIQAEKGSINGCNNSIIVPQYNIQKDLSVGDNMIEFTPTKSGTVPFSCWMGMIRSKITVVDDIDNYDRNTDSE